MEFPQTDSLLIKALYFTRIGPALSDLDAKKVQVDQQKPPTKDDIERFLAQSDDLHIIELLNELTDYAKNVERINKELSEIATESLHSPANSDERQANRSSFNALKKQIIEYLHSLGVVAAEEDQQEVVEWVKDRLDSLPKVTTTTTGNLKEMRQWLQVHHPEANVKSRGTIPLEWQRRYYESA